MAALKPELARRTLQPTSNYSRVSRFRKVFIPCTAAGLNARICNTSFDRSAGSLRKTSKQTCRAVPFMELAESLDAVAIQAIAGAVLLLAAAAGVKEVLENTEEGSRWQKVMSRHQEFLASNPGEVAQLQLEPSLESGSDDEPIFSPRASAFVAAPPAPKASPPPLAPAQPAVAAPPAAPSAAAAAPAVAAPLAAAPIAAAVKEVPLAQPAPAKPSPPPAAPAPAPFRAPVAAVKAVEAAPAKHSPPPAPPAPALFPAPVAAVKAVRAAPAKPSPPPAAPAPAPAPTSAPVVAVKAVEAAPTAAAPAKSTSASLNGAGPPAPATPATRSPTADTPTVAKAANAPVEQATKREAPAAEKLLVSQWSPEDEKAAELAKDYDQKLQKVISDSALTNPPVQPAVAAVLSPPPPALKPTLKPTPQPPSPPPQVQKAEAPIAAPPQEAAKTTASPTKQGMFAWLASLLESFWRWVLSLFGRGKGGKPSMA